ncbi:Uma2 family endonuclease [Streptomyces sp. NPDC006739]|uniref:Uma2 family endonuclease n=1 Tax=Streptomyces sp. NPDC006739 TaxID=3364763 RepID=UPI0036CC508B
MTLMAERPVMSDPKPREGFDEMLDVLDELKVPAGYKAEIINRNIILSPLSKGYYTRVMRSVCAQLEPHLPEGHIIERSPDLFVFPGVERAYGPDIHAAHARTYETDSIRLDGEGLSLVGELTSHSTRDVDLADKAQMYGRSGVPVYLLLDMQEERTTVFWLPSDRGYQARLSRSFGEKMEIPDPFGCILDTTGFTLKAT